MAIIGFGPRPQAQRRLRDAVAASQKTFNEWRETPGDSTNPAKQAAYEKYSTAVHEEVTAMGGTNPILSVKQYRHALQEGYKKAEKR